MAINLWLGLGAIFGFFGVAAGAFGAHALKEVLSPALQVTFETAVRYQMYHALALVLLGLVPVGSSLKVGGPAACFTIGIVIFSGSLYALALSSVRWFGAITPIGGVAFLAGWGWLAVAALTRNSP